MPSSKSQIPNSNTSSDVQERACIEAVLDVKASAKPDLEERTFIFARDVRALVRKLTRNPTNWEDSKQLIRSSGSVGANYIEANESLGEKDFAMHIRISRKESKESEFWLRLLNHSGNSEHKEEIVRLSMECHEFRKIFSAILRNSINRQGK